MRTSSINTPHSPYIIKKDRLLAIIGTAITVVILYFIVTRIDTKSVWNNLRLVNPLVVIAMVAIYLSTFPIRMWRWSLMLKATDDRSKILESIILGFTFNNLLPARAGELVRIEHFSRWSGRNRITTLTSILSEKILDCIVLLVLLIVCGFFYSTQFGVNDSMLKFPIIFGAIIIVVIAAIIIVYKKRDPVTLLLSKWNMPIFVRTLFARVCESFGFLSDSRGTFIIVLLSVLIWILEGLVFVIGVGEFGIQQPLLIGFATLCIVNFGILVPSSPGYVGVFQLAFIFSFSLFRLDSDVAMSSSVLVHSCQYFPITLIGVIIVFRNSLKKRS